MEIKRGIVIFILLAAAIVLLVFMFYSKTCQDSTCFNSALYNCNKATFISQEKDTVYEYKIIGKSDGNCRTDVTLLQLSKGDNTLQALEGKQMSCFTQLGSTLMPNQNLDNCHGQLKEEMQNILIKRLHSYIISNLGEIGTELKDVV